MSEPLRTDSSSRSCWWLGCTEHATNYVTWNDVTRCYCPAHMAQVERYAEAAARWEAKTEHTHG